MRIFEDFLDDTVVVRDTALQRLSDDADDRGTPEEYRYYVLVCDAFDKIRTPEQFVSILHRMENVLESNLKEYSEIFIDTKLDALPGVPEQFVRHIDNHSFQEFKFGFQNTMRGPRQFYRLIMALLKLVDCADIMIYDNGFPLLISKATDADSEYDMLDSAYRLFPYDRYGFKTFDAMMQLSSYTRLEDIADVETVIYKSQFNGTIDLNKILDDPDANMNYSFAHYKNNKQFIPDGCCDECSRETLDNLEFRNSDLKFREPYYQFGFDSNSGDAFYAVDILLGPVYLKNMNIVVELTLSCTLFDSNDGRHGFKNDLPEFLENVNGMFNGKMPDVLREAIINEISNIAEPDDDEDTFL